MQIPVYLFTGFLESGKTKFIQETMEDPRFNTGEKTLILVCEEGFIEYDATRFCADGVYLEMIDQESDLSQKYLKTLLQKHSAKRVLIEYNGMWQLKSLLNALPKNWLIVQEFMFAETTTFLNYNQNMRSLVVDKLNNAELVVFNRYTKQHDKMALHKVVRGVNTRATIAYEYANGDVDYDDIEDPLPFDKTAAVISVEDKDYAYFYRDLSEHLQDYHGKTVQFTCVIAKNDSLKANQLVVGRHVMTCCIDDITFAGFLLTGQTADRLFDGFENRDWARVTARVQVEPNEIYGRTGPVLYAESLEKAPMPQTEIATFY